MSSLFLLYSQRGSQIYTHGEKHHCIVLGVFAENNGREFVLAEASETERLSEYSLHVFVLYYSLLTVDENALWDLAKSGGSVAQYRGAHLSTQFGLIRYDKIAGMSTIVPHPISLEQYKISVQTSEHNTNFEFSETPNCYTVDIEVNDWKLL